MSFVCGVCVVFLLHACMEIKFILNMIVPMDHSESYSTSFELILFLNLRIDDL